MALLLEIGGRPDALSGVPHVLRLFVIVTHVHELFMWIEVWGVFLWVCVYLPNTKDPLGPVPYSL